MMFSFIYVGYIISYTDKHLICILCLFEYPTDDGDYLRKVSR